MIEVKVRSADACTVKSETLTRGRVGAMIHFNFSEEWDGLDRVAVFSNGVTDIDVYLESDTVPVPPEMFMEAGRSVKVGVRGDHVEGDVVTVVIPTVYTLLGTVFNGTDISGNASADITPSLAEQIMAVAGTAVETANSVREDANSGAFDGDPGFSPTVSVTDIEGGHRVTITDAEGDHVFDVMDGQGGGGEGSVDVFNVEYGTTPLTAIKAANDAGKICRMKIGARIYYLCAMAGTNNAVFICNNAAGKDTAVQLSAVNGWSEELDAYRVLASAISKEISAASTDGQVASAKAVYDALTSYATKDYVNNHHDDTKQDTISDLATIRSGASKGATAYQKPSGGIPASDLASGVIPSVPTALSQLSGDSTHRVVTDAEKSAWGAKQDKLTAGDNITIDGNVISSTGGGGFHIGPEAPENTEQLWVDTDDSSTDDDNDYDMVVEINQIQGSSNFQPRITYGSAQDLIAKLEASDNYAPRVLIKSEIYYGTVLTRSKQIASPSLTYNTSDPQISLVFHWVFPFTQCCVYTSSDGSFGVDVVWLRTN